MLTFYFVRHGETFSNTWHTFQGHSDTPLTQLGITQGMALGKGLYNVPFLKIYTSTSERAYDTACLARANRTIELIMCKGLKEMNFGLLETKPNHFKGCETYQERIMYDYARVNGENFTQLCERMKQTLHDLVADNKDLHGNIMCVTHGISILAIIYCIDKAAYEECLEKVRFGNCSVTMITWENDTFKIDAINNMHFVEKGEINEKNN